ncbi:DUF3231 family protein [Mesobacillus harenae]|uniref:DUF3231 family protein n=1 Tax=Mesobacillus harenae TaxID=2213203 RepID=UPI0015805CA3|nr:DUF3231 family protein [Mesobacillus harenae]
METTYENKHSIRLTSAEISNLWITYMNNSLSKYVLSYFLNTVEDSEIRSVIDYALNVSLTLMDGVENIFNGENYPIPYGFTDDDVNLSAPRLYSDEFFLNYIDQMAKAGFSAYGMSTAMSSRLDVQAFFNEAVALNIEINKRTKAVLLSKGLHLRPPYISPPEKVDFVKHQSFLTGWFGSRKPLLSVEITNLFHNLQTNAIGKAFISGFAQTAKTKDARDYFKRGKDISNKHIKVFTSILTEEDIPVPRSWDDEVLASSEAPFSDKLMMFQVSLLSALGVGNYGVAMSASTRRDLTAHFARLSMEIGQYAEDGANLSIKHRWLEQPPQSVDKNGIVYKN